MSAVEMVLFATSVEGAGEPMHSRAAVTSLQDREEDAPLRPRAPAGNAAPCCRLRYRNTPATTKPTAATQPITAPATTPGLAPLLPLTEVFGALLAAGLGAGDLVLLRLGWQMLYT